MSFEAIKKSEKNYQYYPDNLPFAFSRQKIIRNNDGKQVDLMLLDVNDVFEEKSGKDHQELVGRKISVLFPEIMPKLHYVFKEYSSKVFPGSRFEFELYLDPVDRWYDIFVIITAEDEQIVFFSDCTDRKIAEVQIANLNHLFLELGVDSLKNIDIIVRKTCEILKGACSLYNRLDDENKSLIVWSEFNAPEDVQKKDIPRGHICYEVTIKGKNKPVVIEDLKETEYFHTDPNVKKYGLRSYIGHPVIIDEQTIGSLCIVDIKPRKFTDTEIKIIGSLAKALSLEQKRYFVEESLKNARIEAEKANNSKNQFLANMSHEIRTPLNSIMGFSEMLISQEADDRKARLMQMIEYSGNQLLQIINDIFDYSKIEAGKISLMESGFILSEVIKDIVDFFEQALKKKNLQLIVNKDDLDENDLFGDYYKLKQILYNVISNAIKFTEKGYVNVSVSSEKSDDKVQTKIIVEDTGIGIDKDQLSMIFDEFKQLDYYLTKKINGTGLGLAITKKLIDILHGSIIVESEIGKGSKFIINIPFQTKTKTIIKPKIVMNKPTEDKESESRKIKILLAEDNEANQFLIKAITKSQGWEITVVDDGEKVIEEYDNDEYDLILMDIQMPVMNGYEATSIIREKERKKGIHIPIIALTAFAMKSDKDLCIDAGMDGYISKPFKRQQFLDAITNALKG